MAIDYDATAAEYQASLVTKLRGHGAGSFLQHWVPDPDPVLGIFNMVEAAWTDGRDELAVTVSRAMLGPAQVEPLKALAGSIAQLQLDETPAGYQLTFKRAERKSQAKSISKTAVKSPAARRDAERSGIEVTWDIHPSLAGALDVETREMRHENPTAKDAVLLEVDEETGLIQKASHSGIDPPVRRNLVELMCRAIEGRTVQDASDHAAVYALHTLHRRAGVRPSQGILLPANAGLEVIAALEAVRAACRATRGTQAPLKEENFFELGPRSEWQAAQVPEKLRRAVESAVTFITQENLPASSIKPVRVEKDIHGHEVRVVVQVSGQIPADSVPSVLRNLERHFKASLDPALQVYLEQWKDKSVLRRL